MTTTPATVPPETSSALPETDAVTCARAGLGIPPARITARKKTLDMPPATLEHATFTLPVIRES
jgi:hypothetical protein